MIREKHLNNLPNGLGKLYNYDSDLVYRGYFTDGVIKDKSYQFSIKIVRLCQRLQKERNENVVKHLLKI